MDEKIQQIINELVALDPGFANHRGELEQILASVLAARPNASIDSEFVRALRARLLEKTKESPAAGWSTIKNTFMKKIMISASVVVVVLLAAAVMLQNSTLLKTQNNQTLSFGSDVRVMRTQDKAFGSLAQLTTTGTGGSGKEATNLTTPAPDEAQIAYGMGGGVTDASLPSKLMAPYQTVNYKYVYKGEDLNLESNKLDVLKKQTPSTGDLAAGLNSLGLGLLDLNSFPGSKVQSVSFNQENGYNIYVDLVGGTVSVSGYFEAVPLAASSSPQPIRESDIPDDTTLVSIANQFLSDHNISRAAYGEPEVQNTYRIQYKAMLSVNPKAEIYWPESVSVVYPLKVQDGEVYDESGQKMGLMVDIGVRSHKVNGLYNLSTQSYEASSYDAETDPAAILKIAEVGGLYGYSYDDAGTKTVEIDLGTPTMQYVSMWDYQNNLSQQVLVPSLVFPVENAPTDGSFYRQAVVVPLIKDILARYGNNGGTVPPIRPLDLPNSVMLK